MKVLEVNRAMLGKQNQCRQLIELLSEIKAVGFDALYLLPVQQKGQLRAVGSPYCLKDFWNLDSDFGTDKDWECLRMACEEMQLEIWLDWVMNHTAWDHPWMNDFPHRYVTVNQEIQHPSGTNWLDVAQLNFNDSMANYFAELAVEWMMKRGIKGFRCDASYRIPVSFWNEFFSCLGSSKPKARWFADKNFPDLFELHFDGFFTDGPLVQDSCILNKIYDHDRSAFGELWNENDAVRFNQMKGDDDGDLNWLVGMGMIDPNQRVSFFENQDFDQEKWSSWLKQF